MNHALLFGVRSNCWERSSGAHRIATYLRKHGMDVEVVDFAPFWELDLLKEFTRKSVTDKTLFFGFSIFFSFWNQNMIEFCDWLKIEFPHIKTVVGGQNILHHSYTKFDIWIDSYGEEAILALAKSLAGNSTNGIVFAPEYFGKRKVIKALTSYPSYNMGDYSVLMQPRDFAEPWEWLTIEFSRGCKFSCAFCNFPILGVKEDTSRSAESFEIEMKHNFENFGITRYYVADETFNDRIEKITKFADVVDQLDFDVFYSGFIRADLLSNRGMIEELARMKFGGQYYGVETFNHDSGKMIGKGLHPERVKQLMLDTRNYFLSNDVTYRGTISLIVGLPFDTHQQWESNIGWLKENWITEGLVAFPLDIESLDDDREMAYTNVSKFAKNLKKYGLRSMGSSKNHRFNMKDSHFNWRQGNYAQFDNLWEHDTMNVFEAREIAIDLQEMSKNEFGLDSWCLSWPETIRKRKLDCLQHHINLPKKMSYPGNVFDAFIRSYSLKKINQ